MIKLDLFSYTRETFTSRKIERLAEENLYARWLTQERVPSYRTIARFCVYDVQELTNKGLDQLTEHLCAWNMIEDANKNSFVRDFKEYQAEKTDADQALITEALTPKENRRKITVNPFWEYHKEK